MALTPEDVLNKNFTATQFRRGYDEQEVDDFLDEVVAELRRLTQERDDLCTQLEECRKGEGGRGRRPPRAPPPRARRPSPPRSPPECRAAPAPSRRRREAAARSRRRGPRPSRPRRTRPSASPGPATPPPGPRPSRPTGCGPPPARKAAAGAGHRGRGRWRRRGRARWRRRCGRCHRPGPEAARRARRRGAEHPRPAHRRGAGAPRPGGGRGPDQARRARRQRPAPPRRAPGDRAEAPRELLDTAQRQHDELIAEATTRHDTMITRGPRPVHRHGRPGPAAEAGDPRRARPERDLLQKKIAELRSFERNYRARLKSYLESQLHDLESAGGDQSGRSEASEASRPPHGTSRRRPAGLRSASFRHAGRRPVPVGALRAPGDGGAGYDGAAPGRPRGGGGTTKRLRARRRARRGGGGASRAHHLRRHTVEYCTADSLYPRHLSALQG